MTTSKNWFEVDRIGLAKILEKRGKAFAVYELIQNAWDTDATEVDVVLEVTGVGKATLTVGDNSSKGFVDLSHAYTLFAESEKKGDPEKRGRFNLGEKLVIAICTEATIASTKGAVRFDAKGRHRLHSKLGSGTVITVELKMTKAEVASVVARLYSLRCPQRVRTTINGNVLVQQPALKTIRESLYTEIAGPDGVMRSTKRKTDIDIVAVDDAAQAYLYEMGIPVVEIDCAYHIDVQQKIPLNLDRDNVGPAYLRTVTTLAFNAMHDQLTETDVTTWAAAAVSEPGASIEAVESYLDVKYGKNRVTFDATSPESNKEAVAAGYRVIHGASESKGTWEKIREGQLAPPASKQFPQPGGKVADKVWRPDEYTAGMRRVVAYSSMMGLQLLGEPIRVRIIEDRFIAPACYGKNELTYNVSGLGLDWFDKGVNVDVNDLLLHELGHHYSRDHLSADYYNAVTKLGAKMVELAVQAPHLFVSYYPTDASGVPVGFHPARYPSHTVSEDMAALYQSMQTPEARRGMHAAFNATPEELGEAAVEAARIGRDGRG